MIYFVRDRINRCIKIGLTSNVKRSVSVLQGGNVNPLEIVTVLSHRRFENDDLSVPPLSVEWLKAKFRKHKIRNTWFHEEPVLEWLETGCAKNFMIPNYDL